MEKKRAPAKKETKQEHGRGVALGRSFRMPRFNRYSPFPRYKAPVMQVGSGGSEVVVYSTEAGSSRPNNPSGTWCSFHGKPGYNTQDCWSLQGGRGTRGGRNGRGRGRWSQGRGRGGHGGRREDRREGHDPVGAVHAVKDEKEKPYRVISMIMAGAGEVYSARAMKRLARSIPTAESKKPVP